MQDSVNLIDEMRTNPPVDMTDEEVADCISRNVEHLEIMVAKDYWTTEDMKAVNAAIDKLKIKGFKIMLSILSGILGFATSGLPSVLKFFEQKGDQNHEREMAKIEMERSLAMAEKGFASQEKN